MAFCGIGTKTIIEKTTNIHCWKRQKTSVLKKNDLFFLVYAIPAIILMIIGFSFQFLTLVYISVGITLYGFTYFIIHDIIIHNRLQFPLLSKKPNLYIRAIIKAHTAHHWPKNKNDFHNYGLLIFPFSYFKS
jgi:beta-carotene 3-hydroxylase